MHKRSLGLIETWGHIPAVEAADAGCKAANVALAGYEEVRAGLVTIMFVGDVAAVTTAVSAGAAAAARVGKIVSCHVIARPDRQLECLPTLPRPPSAEPAREPPSSRMEQVLAPADTAEASAAAVDEPGSPAEQPGLGSKPKTSTAPRAKTGSGTGKKSKRPPRA